MKHRWRHGTIHSQGSSQQLDYCVQTPGSRAAIREAAVAKLLSDVLQLHMDYLHGHLREWIVHAKCTGRSLIGQNTHCISTEKDLFTVSF